MIAEAKRERQEGTLALLVLEAALLIEEHYDEIVMNSGIFIPEEKPRGKTDGIPWVFQREGTADFFESVEGSRVPETLQCCDRQ